MIKQTLQKFIVLAFILRKIFHRVLLLLVETICHSMHSGFEESRNLASEGYTLKLIDYHFAGLASQQKIERTL